MKEQMQTIEGNENGNCLAACISSILEVDINDIPSFPNDKEWLENLNRDYLNGIGFHLMTISTDNPDENLKGHHLIIGYNKMSDCYHAKVGLNGKEIFDPSIMKSELTGVHYGILLKIL